MGRLMRSQTSEAPHRPPIFPAALAWRLIATLASSSFKCQGSGRGGFDVDDEGFHEDHRFSRRPFKRGMEVPQMRLLSSRVP
jgi:hypothetical protein